MTRYYCNTFNKLLAHITRAFDDVVRTLSVNGKRCIKILEAGAG